MILTSFIQNQIGPRTKHDAGRWFGALIFALSLALLGGCAESKDREPAGTVTPFGTCNLSFKHVGACARVVWENTPTNSEDGSLYLEFYKEADPGLLTNPPGQIAIIYALSESLPPLQSARVIQTNEGQYRVGPLSMRVAGSWRIEVQLMNDNAVIDEDVLMYTRL
jgi:hypothetical protein